MSKKTSFSTKVRIISAIATKDVVDAVKNRTILSIVVGVFFVVLASRAMSLLIKLRQIEAAIVVGPEASEFVDSLGESEGYQVVDVPDMETMQEVLATSATPCLGLVLPDDWQDLLVNQEALDITGYSQHWLSQSDRQDLLWSFENHIGQVFQVPVTIEAEGNLVYPTLQFSGSAFMTSMGLATAVMVIGLILVPMLMLEEKEQRTIDVLLISPASYPEIIIGKAIAGMIYSLAAVLVIVLVNANYVVQWPILLAGILAGISLTVMIGLFLGTIFEQASTMNAAMGIIVLPLLGPIFLRQFNPGTLPAWLDKLLPWIPSTALDELFRLSFIQESHPDRLIADLSLLVGGVILMLILNAWRVRQLTV